MKKTDSYSFKGFSVWFVCAVFFLYEFLLRTVIGTFQHPIMYDLQLSSFKFSILSSTSYLIVYGFMQIPTGIIVDNYGLKKSLFVACLLCGIASVGFGYSNSYELAIFFRIITALGSAFGFVCLLFAVYDWMPKNNIAFLIGISQFIGTMGPMLAAGPLEHMSSNSNYDWRYVFNFLGIFGFVLTAIILFVVSNNPNKSGQYKILNIPEPAGTSFRQLFKRAQPLLVAVLCSCIYFPVEYLSENEGRSFIISNGFSSEFASYLITIAWLSYAISCPTLGFISDKIQRRKVVIAFATLVSLAGFLLMLLCYSQETLVIAFIMLGIGASGQGVGFAIMAEQFKKKYLAVGLALNNAAMTISAGFNAPAIGAFLDHFEASGVSQQQAYQFAFSGVFLVFVLTSVVCIYFIKETFCKSDVDFTYLNRK